MYVVLSHYFHNTVSRVHFQYFAACPLSANLLVQLPFVIFFSNWWQHILLLGPHSLIVSMTSAIIVPWKQQGLFNQSYKAHITALVFNSLSQG